MFPAPADAASVLVTDLGLLLGPLLMRGLLDPREAAARALFGLTTGVLIVTYGAWRWYDTVPRLEPTAESLWPCVFFTFETVAIVYTLMSIVILMRNKDRRG